ncbi:RNase H family protein [Salinimonas chungwhensis]|uniref:RNase H family protein n=1 Tax=Salinimonas chungwhensis TaxID=265425 RepID=UPI000361E25A|nr:RNase H family protein [Salinimonas chungwhensis]
MTTQDSTITANNSRHIYTDGAAPNNQSGCRLGGIGVAVLSGGNEIINMFKEAVIPQGGEVVTTNNRCEMLALIKALKVAQPDDIIHSDNELAVRGYNEWLAGWKARGWKKSNKKPVGNRDLWMIVDALKEVKPTVKVKWVRGHNGCYGNELADQLANEAVIQAAT